MIQSIILNMNLIKIRLAASNMIDHNAYETDLIRFIILLDY